MKKMIITAILSFSGLFAQAAELKVSISPNAPYVLPVSLPTCREAAVGAYPADGVKANSLEYTRFKFQWTGDQTSFQFSAIKAEFKDPNLSGGSYQCLIAGEELYALLGNEVLIASGDQTEYGARCSLRCGGIAFGPTGPSWLSIAGTLTIYGLEIDSQGVSRPLVTTKPIGLYYQSF